MGTRSHIGVINSKGVIDVVHCQYDGYLSFTGKRLIDSYNDLSLAKQLIKGGNMSVLGAYSEKGGKPMKFSTIHEYRRDIENHFTDIEYFYLYEPKNIIMPTVGWWYSRDGITWYKVNTELNGEPYIYSYNVNDVSTMDIIIKKLVDGGVIVKSDDDGYTMNDGNYTLTVYNGESNQEIHEIYNEGQRYYGVVYDENGCDTSVKINESNLMLVKKIDIMTL